MKKIILPVAVAALIVLALPSQVDAYGAAHRGYTHVGPGGVYHTGRTAVAGPRGVAVGGRTTAVGYGGGVYRGGYGGAAGYGGAGGYRYGSAGYGFGGVGGYGYHHGSNYNTNAAAAAANGAYR